MIIQIGLALLVVVAVIAAVVWLFRRRVARFVLPPVGVLVLLGLFKIELSSIHNYCAYVIEYLHQACGVESYRFDLPVGPIGAVLVALFSGLFLRYPKIGLFAACAWIAFLVALAMAGSRVLDLFGATLFAAMATA